MKQIVETWVYEAGENIRKRLTETLQVETKAHANDLVTNVDRETEEFFVGKIKEYYPDDKVLGEEGISDEVTDLTGRVWIIDPIDGTMNFVHQKQFFAISLAVYQDGEALWGFVYDVMHDELFFAEHGKGAYLNGERLSPLKEVPLSEAIISFNTDYLYERPGLELIVKKARGIRAYGACSLEMAYVAKGRLDAFVSDSISAWDYCAGKLIVEEVGGTVISQIHNQVEYLKKEQLIVATPSLLSDLQNACQIPSK
ncbi:inositol monophosphatase family protein [Salipaludibacillus daqingensis]|uniref:inositol monophosphatase family protein n=1 Tax=Salipaludibacillus daqingensis TaxID=3041001 RepID=UPI002476E9FF|nr:inositol monophosphatase family protein [Salipaludibacillus daqingensis]